MTPANKTKREIQWMARPRAKRTVEVRPLQLERALQGGKGLGVDSWLWCRWVMVPGTALRVCELNVLPQLGRDARVQIIELGLEVGIVLEDSLTASYAVVDVEHSPFDSDPTRPWHLVLLLLRKSSYLDTDKPVIACLAPFPID